MTNFWQQLSEPFFVLAPMEDVTDTVFRQIVAQVGKPDIFFTEFAHVDAILHGEMQRLSFTEKERPIVAQIWGTVPEQFAKAAEVIRRLGFDGIDLNMGCPVRDVTSQGACSALIGKNAQAQELIQATKEGGGGLPVSVKTRIGTKKIITEEWIGFLLDQQLSALTIHGRTAAEMSKVPAHWDEIAKAVKLNTTACKIIGNGDVKSLAEAHTRIEETGVDGVMVGRGIFDNIGLFGDKNLSQDEKIALLKDHINLFEKTWGSTKNFQILKKFVKAYINGFEGASARREQLMQAKSLSELRSML